MCPFYHHCSRNTVKSCLFISFVTLSQNISALNVGLSRNEIYLYVSMEIQWTYIFMGKYIDIFQLNILNTYSVSKKNILYFVLKDLKTNQNKFGPGKEKDWIFSCLKINHMPTDKDYYIILKLLTTLLVSFGKQQASSKNVYIWVLQCTGWRQISSLQLAHE